jgi:DNA-binding MarR family transcriptional regulator
MTTTPLTPAEERLWRAWVRLNAEMTAVLQRDLQEDGLSGSDFEVLVHLGEDPEGRARVTDLASVLHWERSRLSHHVGRMERRDLVHRVECAEDGRGAFVVLTDAGRTALDQALPGHARSLRRVFFDPLGVEDREHLEHTVAALLAVHAPR